MYFLFHPLFELSKPLEQRMLLPEADGGSDDFLMSNHQGLGQVLDWEELPCACWHWVLIVQEVEEDDMEMRSARRRLHYRRRQDEKVAGIHLGLEFVPSNPLQRGRELLHQRELFLVWGSLHEYRDSLEVSDPQDGSWGVPFARKVRIVRRSLRQKDLQDPLVEAQRDQLDGDHREETAEFVEELG